MLTQAVKPVSTKVATERTSSITYISYEISNIEQVVSRATQLNSELGGVWFWCYYMNLIIDLNAF